MAPVLAQLADALRAAGLKVREYPGWKTRGQTDGPFTPIGVMWHHDASAPGDSPGVVDMMANLANNGAQTWVDRYGTWHLIATGRMWHAGSGGGWGRIRSGQGNTLSVGVETDHTTGEDWPPALLSGLRCGTAVLLRLLGSSPHDSLCGHKEYRITNPDPHGLDMAQERTAVAALMANPQTANPEGFLMELAPWEQRRLFERTMSMSAGVAGQSTAGAQFAAEQAQRDLILKKLDALSVAVQQQHDDPGSPVHLNDEQLAALKTSSADAAREGAAAATAGFEEELATLKQLIAETDTNDATQLDMALRRFYGRAVNQPTGSQ